MTLMTEVKMTQYSPAGIKREWHGAAALKNAGAPMPAGLISPTTRQLADLHRAVLIALREEFSGPTPGMSLL